ncbi:transmembrane protein 230-like isoform X2 [Myotis daubentonii]|uniref:transmembrane protein 230-like isoform X2 n=1 Tax=Myotis daubentonii TaxID=98922 RepID=UPI00287380CA|nr:transmembrane protein 230-like isoform X2 [Myotis daubentonii]
MVPARTNVPAGIPRSKVKYSMLPSTEDGHMDPQKDTLPESPAKVPYKAITCFALQFLIGAVLLITGCLLLAGYLSEAGPSRAIAILIVGILVLLPGFYHLLIACKAHRGCPGYSYQDLPDCGD